MPRAILRQRHRLASRVERRPSIRDGFVGGGIRGVAVFVVIIAEVDPRVEARGGAAPSARGGVVGVEMAPGPVGAAEDGDAHGFGVGGVRLAGGRGQSKRTGGGVAVAGDVERVVVLDVRVEPADVHLDGPVGRAGGDHDAGRDDARGVPGPDLGVRTDAGVGSGGAGGRGGGRRGGVRGVHAGGAARLGRFRGHGPRHAEGFRGVLRVRGVPLTGLVAARGGDARPDDDALVRGVA